jgi:class 3 adenylate cyclase
MDIAATLGPERLRELMTEVVARSATVVQRYGGFVNQFTGDGFMALFGAPIAIEDHALRACIAALDIQSETRSLAADVERRDGISLRLRIGLNSGEVVAGDIASGPGGYTLFGRQVGMAQRMESAAPSGGVMLSESTARLVEQAADLDDPEAVRIKGSDEPVPARRLLAVSTDHHWSKRRESPLVGRDAEMSTLAAMLDEATDGRGLVAGVVGPPGIGKSRLTREVSALAADRGVDVIRTFCESHSKDIPFHAAAGLLRDFFGVSGLASDAARAKTRMALPDSDPDDLELLADLLEIRDAGPPVLAIDPDARRRRLASLLDTALLERRDPAVYVIEDAHWMDAVSESMLAEFLAIVPRTPSFVLVTYRPEYRGVLSGRAIFLAPLGESEASKLTADLLGPHDSVAALAAQIAERSAGNPFFTEEIVRDLAERGVIEGERGKYVRRTEGDVIVPPTVQATIAARIDRLSTTAKRTLNAASVIGSRFGAKLLSTVLDEVALAELIAADLVERVPVSPSPEYAFRHPLLRAVAYESQLKAGRAALHRTIAAAIEQADPESVEANAALIATHQEAAGDLRAAFDSHMRAGGWATHRDIVAARMSWQRAVAVADQLPQTEADRLSMRIAPRTLLCATSWRVGGSLADVGFDELRELATAAGDKRSLAIGMTGLVQMNNLHGEFSEASRLASEHVELLESIGDPELIVGLLTVPIVAKWDAGEMAEAMRLSQLAINLSGGDPTMGNLIIGSPLAFMLALRASTRCCLGVPGWRQDFDRSVEIARDIDPFTYNTVVMIKYVTIFNWALLPDDAVLHETAEALETAKQLGDNFQLANAEFTHGLALIRSDGADRDYGFELLEHVRQTVLNHRYIMIAAFCVDLDVAAEKNRSGDYDSAIALCRSVLDRQIRTGEGINRGWATTVLVQALLGRHAAGDINEAKEAVDRLAAMPTEPVYLYHELPLLRLNALLAEAGGDDEHYQAFRDQYRARAASTGMEGHIELARAMD